MGAALGLLGRAISFGARGGSKLLGVAKNTAFTGLTNPFKTRTGKALGLLTVGQGLLGGTTTSGKEMSNMVSNTSSKYFG